MTNDTPILYLVDASVAVTGAFVAARNAARTLKTSARIVLVLPDHSTIAAAELTDFWRVDYVPMVSLSKKLSAMLRYLPALLIGAWCIHHRMKADGATRLWLNDFYLMHGSVLRLLGYRGHIISWVRCDPVRFAGPLTRPMLALCKRSANRVVAVSAFIRALVLPNPSLSIIYDIYNGRTRAPKNWQPTDEKTFVYIGNYIAGKGQDVALAAFAKAASQDSSIRLAFYGGDMGLPKNRDYRQRLEMAAQQNGLAGRVTFHGFVADTYEVLATAYAALNFSEGESFSMTVLEASGAGVPVIATASGGPQEIIVDGSTGQLISVGDVDAAAAQILALASDPTRAANMGEAGAQHVRARFAESSFRKALQSLFALPEIG
jgi:glycosyltransferase involved in cell wall biosynthesis